MVPLPITTTIIKALILMMMKATYPEQNKTTKQEKKS